MTSPTLVGTAASTGNVSSIGVTPGVTIPAETVVIVSIHAGGSGMTLGVSDAQGNTWQAHDISAVSSITTRLFTCKVVTPITGAITATRSTSGGMGIVVGILTGYSATPVDTDVGSNAAAVVSHAAAASTVPSGGGVVIVAATTNTGRTYSGGAGTTLLGQIASSGTGNPRVGGLGFIDSASAGSVQPILTSSIANTFTASSIVLVPESAPPAGPNHPTVAIIGDSLTFRADENNVNSRETVTRGRLEAAGWDADSIYWHARGGKTMLTADTAGLTTLQNITAAVSQLGPDPIDQIVIALGTNDVGMNSTDFGNAIDTILNACESAGIVEVFWINLGAWSPNNTNSIAKNPIIKQKVEARTFGRYLDFNAMMGNPRTASDWIFPVDSSHLTVQGYQKRDDWMITALDFEESTSSLSITYWNGVSESTGITVSLWTGTEEVPINMITVS